MFTSQLSPERNIQTDAIVLTLIHHENYTSSGLITSLVLCTDQQTLGVTQCCFNVGSPSATLTQP